MKNLIFFTALFSGFITTCIAQQNAGTVPNNILPVTLPANLSQLEVQGRLFTQNLQIVPSGTQVTGSFAANARWNSLGNLNAGSQTLNGLRTQTDGRGLVFGHSINSTGVLSNPFIQWIGNLNAANVSAGSLDFIVADNPGSPTVPANDRFVLRLRQDGKNVLGQADIGGNYLASMDVTTDPNRIGGLFMDVKNITQTVIPKGIDMTVRANSLGGSGITALVFSTSSGVVNGTIIKGVEANVNGAVQTQIGVSGIAGANPGVGNVRYGIYGQSATGTGSFAGYFAGNVFATGIISGSDSKLKTSVQEEIGLQKLMQLKPVSYYFTKAAIKDLKMSDAQQHGFIAQDVEKIFPESISTVNTPIFKTDTLTGASTVERIETFKGINYLSIIGVLTKSIQEQQQMIEALQIQMKKMESSTSNSVFSSKGYSLSQNSPNPFNGRCVIDYTIPTSLKTAVLWVTDLNGKLIQQYNLSTGSSRQIIDANNFAAGIYIYSLVANGTEIISKKMIVAK